MSRCSEAGLNFRITPVGNNAPLEFLTGFSEGILLRRLIRSLKDWHSMVPGCFVQLRFDAFFKKWKGLVFVFVNKDSRKTERFFWVKIKHDFFNIHPRSFNHFLTVDFKGSRPEHSPFPVIMSACMGRIPHWAIRFRSDVILPSFLKDEKTSDWLPSEHRKRPHWTRGFSRCPIQSPGHIRRYWSLYVPGSSWRTPRDNHQWRSASCPLLSIRSFHWHGPRYLQDRNTGQHPLGPA